MVPNLPLKHIVSQSASQSDITSTIQVQQEHQLGMVASKDSKTTYQKEKENKYESAQHNA